MYSREKCQKAIELYLKYDKSVASVIREIGYPSRKTLPRWYKRYLKELETGVVRHTRRSKYSMEQKKAAALLCTVYMLSSVLLLLNRNSQHVVKTRMPGS